MILNGNRGSPMLNALDGRSIPYATLEVGVPAAPRHNLFLFGHLTAILSR